MSMATTYRYWPAAVTVSTSYANGGVDAFNAPWYGSLAWHVPAGQSVTGIAGE
jgi:hypothetical protein